ncbi:NAD-dependent epimerase/dehydratase family protein [Alsobacter sp. R-9]
MTILVTGAGGFVGAHVVASLLRNVPGEAVVATDLAPPPEAVFGFWTSGPVTFETLDVVDRDGVRSAIDRHRPRAVIHMAAITPSLAMETADPLRVIDVDIGGAANVIDAATASPGIERVAVLSSSVVYGFRPDLPSPVPETVPADPLGLYAVSKLACEGLARRFGLLRGVSTVAARVTAVYGPMERPTAHRETMSQLYPLFEALRRGTPISATPSETVRDWTHADDVGDGLCALLAAPSLRHPVYNLSRGVGWRWSQVLDLFRSAGLDIRIEPDASRADASFDAALGRPPLDVSRLAVDTGFRPARNLPDAIARAATGDWR